MNGLTTEESLIHIDFLVLSTATFGTLLDTSLDQSCETQAKF